MNRPQQMTPQTQIQMVLFLLMALILQILLSQADISKISSPLKNFFITENKKIKNNIVFILHKNYVVFIMKIRDSQITDGRSF